MEYNDEQILNVDDYENIAKAYANALKNKGFMIVQIDENENQELIKEIFQEIYQIKSLLFSLGGFMNTGKFYSLTDRQIKKLSLIFDFDKQIQVKHSPNDKTKCFLSFLSHECLLIKNLTVLAEKSNFEKQVKDITQSRLTLLSQILSV